MVRYGTTQRALRIFYLCQGSRRSIELHTMVAKLLFLSKRARPDLQTAIAFLCTRVKEPDIDDYKKLSRVIKHIRATKELHLTLEAESLSVIQWWIDASFAVHDDLRSHTGQFMTLGNGAMYSNSSKQKNNTKSSTEAELVGVNDGLPQVAWTRYFLEAQGYKIHDSVVKQDNMSSMLLENNGKGSSSKRTKHMAVRYFFITDRINAKEVRVEYCPTDMMIADYFTKALQGKQFRLLRDHILNIQAT